MARDQDASAAAAHANSILFFAFMAIGCAYIVAAKFSGLPPVAVTSVPVLIMLAYAACVKFVPFVRLRDDQAGDNLYYLGFLYTLTSLGVSLYQFRADGPAEEIVHNFGIAVASTIAGVALRVVFNQMRRDPSDVEHAARLELSEAARRMRRELDETVVELAHFRRSAQQQVAEGFEHVRENMEEVSGRILSTFEDMTRKASGPFEAASESSGVVLSTLAQRISDSLDESARRLADENEKLAKGTGELTAALRTTTARLAEMQMPDKVIAVQFQPIAASLEATMKGFADEIRRKDEIDREVIDAITRSGAQHQKQASSLASLARSMEKRVEALGETERQATERAEGTLRVLQGLEADRARDFEADAARSRQIQALTTATAGLTAAVAALGQKPSDQPVYNGDGVPSPSLDDGAGDEAFADALELDVRDQLDDRPPSPSKSWRFGSS